MSDHVSVSINQLSTSDQGNSVLSQGNSVSINQNQETYALLQPAEGYSSNEASAQRPNLRSILGEGMSRYLKMVMPDAVSRSRQEQENSGDVERQALLPERVEVGPSSSCTGDTVAVDGFAPHDTRMESDQESLGNSVLPTSDACHDHAVFVECKKDEKLDVTTIKSPTTGCSKVASGLPGIPYIAECRICQEEDEIGSLESPCACSGSLKFAHRKCIQHWCDEKGDTLCEICQKPFEGGYVSAQPVTPDSIEINIGTGWDIASGQPRLFALAADHHFLDADYDEYAGAHVHSAACFRSVALMLVALLLLRHILSMTGGEDEDASTFFMLSLVRAAGFLIPCYIMARAMNALQIRRQRQEAAIAAAAAAAEVTYFIQAGQVQSVVSPGT